MQPTGRRLATPELEDGAFLINKQPVTIENGLSYQLTDNFKALLYGEDVDNINNYDNLVNYLNFTSEAERTRGSVGSASNSYSVGPWIKA